MASSYSDLGLELMVTGENSGTWGDKTNVNLNLIQQAIAGYEEVSIAGGAQTTALAITDATLSNGRNQIIKLTGTITGNQIVTVPDSVEKSYIIINGTTGSFTVQLKTVSGNGVTWSASDKGIKMVYSDGTDVVDTAFTDLSSDLTPQLSGNLDTNANQISFDDGDGIIDDSSNEQLVFSKTASAVNHIQVGNAAASGHPTISAVGDDTNININLVPKGTGEVQSNGTGLATTGKAIAMALVFG